MRFLSFSSPFSSTHEILRKLYFDFFSNYAEFDPPLERLMEVINTVGRAGAHHHLAGFDAQGQTLLHAGRKWASKGGIAKFYEAPSPIPFPRTARCA